MTTRTVNQPIAIGVRRVPGPLRAAASAPSAATGAALPAEANAACVCHRCFALVSADSYFLESEAERLPIITYFAFEHTLLFCRTQLVL